MNASATARPAPLSGIRVIDLGRVIAGPYAGQMLADYGAEVIKVERRGIGDDSRHMTAGCLLDRQGSKILTETSMVLLGNRNKKSISVDLAKPEGQKLVQRLAAVSDVFIENFTPGTAAKLNVGYDTLAALNPRLVYCSVSGWGQTGPNRLRAGFDAALQAATGFMSVTGQPDGTPGAGPVRVGASVIDFASGMNAAFAILLALRQRELTGEGQYIDVSLFDSGIALQGENVQKHLLNGDLVGRHGSENYGGAPARIFKASDGEVFIIAGTDSLFPALCRALDCTDLLEDARFTSGAMQRFVNREALHARLMPLFARYTRAELMELLDRAGVPVAPVNNYQQLFADAHTEARGSAVHVEHPQSDRLNLIASPIKMSKAPARYDRPPFLGEHTDAVLQDVLGMPAAELETLKKNGVV